MTFIQTPHYIPVNAELTNAPSQGPFPELAVKDCEVSEEDCELGERADSADKLAADEPAPPVHLAAPQIVVATQNTAFEHAAISIQSILLGCTQYYTRNRYL